LGIVSVITNEVQLYRKVAIDHVNVICVNGSSHLVAASGPIEELKLKIVQVIGWLVGISKPTLICKGSTYRLRSAGRAVSQ
jgi:hypothetical protein